MPAMDTLWSVGLDEAAGPDSLFGNMASVVAAPDGLRILVADPNAGEMRVFDAATGRLLAKIGRRGGGPGEFRFADRVTITRQGSILAYDRGRGVVIQFDSTGRYTKEVRLESPVSPETLVATDSLFVFSGVMHQGPYTRRAIHVFDRAQGRSLRSFGRLPDAPSEVISQTIGAGLLSWSGDGNLWHAQRAPYLIEKFTPQGELLLSLERENDFLPSAASSYRVAYQAQRMRIEEDPYAVAVAILETEDGTLLHQVWLSGRRYVLDVFDATLLLRASYVGEMPVLVAPLGDSRYAVNGKGPDDQYWVGVVRMHLP